MAFVAIGFARKNDILRFLEWVELNKHVLVKTLKTAQLLPPHC